jgi:hypothetical protein
MKDTKKLREKVAARKGFTVAPAFGDDDPDVETVWRVEGDGVSVQIPEHDADAWDALANPSDRTDGK